MNKKHDKDSAALEFIIDRIEGDNAVLTSSGQECIIPATFLPLEFKVGDVIQATFSTEEMEKKKREIRAKEILNEILSV